MQGTVINADLAERAIKAGAHFLVTPNVNQQVIELANQASVPVLVGAMTPTEIVQAWEWGADLIKLFPANLLGVNYLKAVSGPLDQVKIVPTGGVNIENAKDWLAAGAVGLGLGSSLLTTALIEAEDYQEITRKAKAFSEIVRDK